MGVLFGEAKLELFYVHSVRSDHFLVDLVDTFEILPNQMALIVIATVGERILLVKAFIPRHIIWL